MVSSANSLVFELEYRKRNGYIHVGAKGLVPTQSLVASLTRPWRGRNGDYSLKQPGVDFKENLESSSAWDFLGHCRLLCVPARSVRPCQRHC